VVVAIDTRANALQTTPCLELRLNDRGYIDVGEDGMTSLSGALAGRDIVGGTAPVILAKGDGEATAREIDARFAACSGCGGWRVASGRHVGLKSGSQSVCG